MAPGAERSAERTRGAAVPILVVEDDEGLSSLLVRRLGRDGWAASGVATGAEALAVIERAAPAGPLPLLLLDFRLPDMSGRDLIERLHAQDLRPPFIFMTGFGSEALAVEMMKLGALDYLTKDSALLDVLPHAVAHAASAITREQRLAETERALQAAAEEWRATFDGISDVVMVVDAQHRVQRANRAAARFVERPFSELLGCSFWELVHGRAEPVPECPLSKVGVTLRAEVGVLRRGDRWIRATADPLLDDRGGLRGAVCILADITEAQEAQEALRAAVARIDHLNRVLLSVRNVSQLITKARDPDPLLRSICAVLTETRGYHSAWIALLDEAGHVATLHTSEHAHPCLKRHEDMLGLKRLGPCGQEVLTGGALLVMSAPAAPHDCWLRSEASRCMLFARLQHEQRVLGVLAVASPQDHAADDVERALFSELANDVAFAIVSLERDRARRRAEAALGEQLDLLQVLINSIPNPIFYKGADGRYLGCNEAFTEVVGRPMEQIVGLTVHDVASPELAERHEQADRALIEDGGVQVYDSRVRYADGVMHDVLFTKATFARSGDRQGGLVGVMADVGRQRRLERELRHAGKMQAMGRLAAGIAHEINTPLQFVGLSVDFLRDAFGGLTSLLESHQRLAHAAHAGEPLSAALVDLAQAEQDADLEFVQEQLPKAFARLADGLERVTHIVRSMKDFAHPDFGRHEPADLNRALLNTLTIARAEYKRVAELEMDLGELPPVWCHVGELNQVFLNLIVNAAHAIVDRDGDAGVRGHIVVRTRLVGDHVEVSVSDDGVGMDAALQERIFEPFFTTKEVGRGTGQGLALAHNIVVDRHRGELTVQSTLGVGTVLTARLPVGGPVPMQRRTPRPD